MNSKNFRFAVVVAALAVSSSALAEMMDRPGGIKIGQRMTLRPYVSLSASWDSNVGARHSGAKGDVVWTVNPGLGLNYKAENWSLQLNGYYNYHAYCKTENVNRHNQHSYGQNLRWNWTNTRGGGKGWTLMLSENYQRISMADDISMGGGDSYTADRQQLTFNAGVQRRFNEYWHGDLNGSYYMMDYLNDTSNDKTKALYGWQRWTAGAEAGFAPSRWTDILLSLGYHGYKQDNTGNYGLGRDSQGYNAQFGLGSFATEKISYRALAGWSRFEYANNASSSDGFVYTLSGRWRISDTWNTMLLATSYYQPSERQQASKSRVDSVSWGLTKSLVRNKLRASLDMSYRHVTHDRISASVSGLDYAVDTVSARLGFNYTLNRFLALFTYGEYQRSMNSESDKSEMSGYCDYDRWRITGGLRLTY